MYRLNMGQMPSSGDILIDIQPVSDLYTTNTQLTYSADILTKCLLIYQSVVSAHTIYSKHDPIYSRYIGLYTY